MQWNAGSSSQEWYAYDASGQRILKRSTSGTVSLTTYPFGLEEHGYSGSGTNQSNTYYYSLGGRLIGELTGSSTQFVLTDLQGSVLATISNVAGSAALQGNQTYAPYGSKRYSSGSMGTTKGYTGQYQDALTGLDYYNARYYDPVAGIFLSADTAQGDMQGMDPFAYVGGNPETMSDPTGQRIYCPGCQMGGGDESGGSDTGGSANSVPFCNAIGCYNGGGQQIWQRPQASSGHGGGPAIVIQQQKHDPEAARRQKAAQIHHKADTEQLAGYALFILGDVLNLFSGSSPFDKASAIIDIIASLANGVIPTLGSWLAGGGGRVLEIAYQFSSWLMKGLSVLQGFLGVMQSANWIARNSAKVGATLLLASMTGPAGIFVQGLMFLIRPMIGYLLDVGGHALQSMASVDYAQEQHELAMPIQDWCAQNKGCE